MERPYRSDMLEGLLGPGAIGLNIAAPNKRAALAVTAEMAGRAFGLRPGPVLDALLAREAQSPTGIGYGVAIPHAELFGLDRVRGVFIRLRPPIAFDAVDAGPVDLIFALFSPPNSGAAHLQALARIARRLRSGELRQRLRQAATPDSVRALLSLETRSDAA